MSAITKVNANEGRRDVVASDRTTVFTDGYKFLITASTTPSIADIITAVGVITLPNVYVPGKFNLLVFLNGQLLVQPGTDYTEDTNVQITLSAGHLATITASPSTATIMIMWNRPLPGARDQELNNLQNVTPDIEGAILDNDGGGPFRASPATPTNPLATLADAAAAAAAGSGAFLGSVVGSGGAGGPVNYINAAAIPANTKTIEIFSHIGSMSPSAVIGIVGHAIIDDSTGLMTGGYSAATAGPGPVVSSFTGVVPTSVSLASSPPMTLAVSVYNQGVDITLQRAAEATFRNYHSLIVFRG